MRKVDRKEVTFEDLQCWVESSCADEKSRSSHSFQLGYLGQTLASLLNGSTTLREVRQQIRSAAVKATGGAA